MRTRLALIALLMLALALAGCSSGTPSRPVTSGTPSDGSSAEEPVDSDGIAPPVALDTTTDGEKAALADAQSTEGRKWASGDSNNGTPVEGDAMLVGYVCQLHDDAKQYSILIVDGKPAGTFSLTGDPRYIEADFMGYQPTMDPESDAQKAAFDVASAEIAKVNPGATKGGIEQYVFFFPELDEGTYPEVTVYAAPTLSEFPFASGGQYGWR